MAQGYVGLRFLMEGGLFLNQILSEFEAKQILSGFINGSLKPIIGNPESPFGCGWAVRTESIRAVHTFNPAELQQAAPSQGTQQQPRYGDVPGRIDFGKSGL